MSNSSVGQPKIYRSTTKIIPYQPDINSSNSSQFNSCSMTRHNVHPTLSNNNSMLIATVNGRAVGGGSGTLYSSINGVPDTRSIPSGPNGATKVNASDPQVRKLVYNMYRGLLSTKHERATDIIDAAPQQNIKTDEGVNDRVISMMKQRSETNKEGKMNYGPPPPPPPPPFQTGAPPVRLPSEIAAAAASANKPYMASPPLMMVPPAALAGAMLKDKKPFTYTPGGLNLAEINGQVEQNGTSVMPSQFRGPNDMPIQSRSFKVIQNAYDGSPDPIDDLGSLRVLDWTIRGDTDNLKELLKPTILIRKGALNSSSPSDGGQILPKPKAFFKELQAITDTLPHDGTVSQEELRDHHQPEPRKYAGSSIPSRSFKMLQAMTDTDEGPGPGQSDL